MSLAEPSPRKKPRRHDGRRIAAIVMMALTAACFTAAGLRLILQ